MGPERWGVFFVCFFWRKKKHKFYGMVYILVYLHFGLMIVVVSLVIVLVISIIEGLGVIPTMDMSVGFC